MIGLGSTKGAISLAGGEMNVRKSILLLHTKLSKHIFKVVILEASIVFPAILFISVKI